MTRDELATALGCAGLVAGLCAWIADGVLRDAWSVAALGCLVLAGVVAPRREA